MKWLYCLSIVFILLVPNVHADDEIEQQRYIFEKIKKSINEQPDHWYIRNDRLVYCEDKKYINNVAEHSFPETLAYTDIVISFAIMRAYGESYINFEKPKLGMLTISRYSDKEEIKLFKEMDQLIKIQLYRALKREVGIISDMRENQKKEQAIEVKPVEKEKDEAESNLGKKL